MHPKPRYLDLKRSFTHPPNCLLDPSYEAQFAPIRSKANKPHRRVPYFCNPATGRCPP
jgi:hypothetical protein